MTRSASLCGSSLFGGLSLDAIESASHLMTAVSCQPGEVVFRQGEVGDRLILVDEGELEAIFEMPGGDDVRLSTIGPGEIVGELSLLGDGVRTATVRVVAPTRGWAISRPAFEVLRHDLRPAASEVVHAIGATAVDRLNRLYRRYAPDRPGDPGSDSPLHASIGEVPRDPAGFDYLAGILFFRDFSREQIGAVTEGLARIAVPRGAVVTPAGRMPAALWIVERGAVETTMLGAESMRILRLAGPGRAIGHLGLLGGNACVEGVQSRARERSILIEVPWPRVSELMADYAPAARRFAAALWTDVVRALQHGERPLARTRRRS